MGRVQAPLCGDCQFECSASAAKSNGLPTLACASVGLAPMDNQFLWESMISKRIKEQQATLQIDSVQLLDLATRPDNQWVRGMPSPLTIAVRDVASLGDLAFAPINP